MVFYKFVAQWKGLRRSGQVELSCSLKSTTYIPTVTVARKLVNYITLLKGRKCIFLVCRTQIFGGINNMWIENGKACFDCSFYLFFKFLEVGSIYGRRKYTGHFSRLNFTGALNC